MIIFMIFDLN